MYCSFSESTLRPCDREFTYLITSSLHSIIYSHSHTYIETHADTHTHRQINMRINRSSFGVMYLSSTISIWLFLFPLVNKGNTIGQTPFFKIVLSTYNSKLLHHYARIPKCIPHLLFLFFAALYSTDTHTGNVPITSAADADA